MNSELQTAEWQKNENWFGGWISLYYSKNDTRIWVPKRHGWGWTINWARWASYGYLALFLMAPTALVVVAVCKSK